MLPAPTCTQAALRTCQANRKHVGATQFLSTWPVVVTRSALALSFPGAIGQCLVQSTLLQYASAMSKQERQRQLCAADWMGCHSRV